MNGCAIRLDPTGLPFCFTREPSALSLRPAWAMPVTTKGYTRPNSTVKITMETMAGKIWRRIYFTPRAVMTMSMSLMPMNGAITPPAP